MKPKPITRERMEWLRIKEAAALEERKRRAAEYARMLAKQDARGR